MWHSCVDNYQLSVENSAKAIIFIFEPVEKTHDTASQLERLLNNKIIKEKEIIEVIETIVPIFSEFSVEQHFKTNYGDEKTYTLPWEIFKEKDAKDAFSFARKCLDTAKNIYNFYFPEK